MTAPRTVVVATHNRGKVAEFARMLGDDAAAETGSASVEWLDLSAFPDAGEVEETGHTFRANACLKASEYARGTGHWALADDSGLEVDALGGAPGVYSARFAAMHDAGSGDAANNQLLLAKLESTADSARTARFVCVLALADPQGRIVLTARDTVEGRIMHSPRGTNGFGYDPLFRVEDGRAMAELPPAEKSIVSHRGRALRRLKALLATAWADDSAGGAADGVAGGGSTGGTEGQS